MGYPTPHELPATVICRKLFIPDDPVFVGAFTGALLDLIAPTQWEQYGAITPAQAAEAALTILIDYLNSECGDEMDVRQNAESPCLLEKTDDGVNWVTFANLQLCPPKVRQNPISGGIEYSTDGVTWEPVPTVPVDPNVPYAPPPEPLGGANDSEDRCMAASNAAAVLDQFWRETFGTVAANLNNTLLSVNIFLGEVNRALAGWIWPHATALLEATGFLNFDYGTYMTAPSLTAGEMDSLRWLLYCNSSVVNGLVRFDYQAIYDNMIAELGINPGTALTLLLGNMQSTGLDAAGSVEAVNRTDCSDAPCESFWCYEFDFLTTSHAALISDFDGTYTANYAAGAGWGRSGVGTPSTGFKLTFPAAAAVDGWEFDYLADGNTGSFSGARNISPPYVQEHAGYPLGAVTTLGDEGYQVGPAVSEWSIAVTMGSTANTRNFRVRRLKMWGTGPNPFGEDNCP